MKNKYLTPIISIIKIKSTSLLSSSSVQNTGGVCASSCRVWNICKNKNHGKWCDDKYKFI